MSIRSEMQGNRQDLAPWIAHVRKRGATDTVTPWFKYVFDALHHLGFALDSGVADIESGYNLTFKRGDSQVIVSRNITFPIEGNMPDLQLSDEMESWELTLSIRTPLSVVFEAQWLNPDKEPDPK